MPWVLDSSTSVNPQDGEGWRVIPVSFRVDARAYAFRVVTPSPLPESWTRLGFWTFGQKLEGVWIRSASQPIFSAPQVAEMTLQHISPADTFVVSDPSQVYGIFVTPNRWIPAFLLEVWILTL